MDTQLVTTAMIPTILFMGLVNWLATIIVVENKIFEDVREIVQKAGAYVEQHMPRTGSKIVYFVKCFMCVGFWVGVVQYSQFGGPLRPHLAWATWIANGLLYKAIGHLILQFACLMHEIIEVLKGMTARSKLQYEMLKYQHELQVLALAQKDPQPSASLDGDGTLRTELVPVG